jgi:hypothetical protein
MAMRYAPSFLQPAKRHHQTERYEKQLLRVLDADLPPDAAVQAAEQLRAAKLAELKAMAVLGRYPHTIGSADRLSTTIAQAQKWMTLSTDEIIRRYAPKRRT